MAFEEKQMACEKKMELQTLQMKMKKATTLEKEKNRMVLNKQSMELADKLEVKKLEVTTNEGGNH